MTHELTEKQRMILEFLGGPKEQELSFAHIFTILVIDPDETMRDMIGRIILSMGHWVLPAETLDDAKKECEEKLPDLVVLHGNFPDNGSLVFCSWLKEQQGGEIIPVLTLTEVDAKEGKVAAVQMAVDALIAGSDDFIAKPFTFQELKARLNSLVRNRTLSLKLIDKNKMLADAQAKIIAQERQLLANQLAATAAHELGQPITALKLNCHLLENTSSTDPAYKKTMHAIRADISRLAELVDGLKKINAARTEKYHGDVNILKVDKL